MEKPLGISFEDTGTQSFIVLDEGESIKKASIDEGKDRGGRSNSYKVKKVRNFHKLYLDLGLWPDPKKNQIRNKYYDVRRKNALLKEQVSLCGRNKENTCVNCEKITCKYSASKQALNQALELSTLLMKQIADFQKSPSNK
ncbi:hypothetical protein SteCoe_18247 [Stentor coeruleus]|uniref:Uncharacterized protein n=1 Tax=Stentor coeruleus TaxID=5963 RepID=A0A1R2BX29_9CILI|nr:hypothetical protein SteCoe_18247 [Stentor coeruleus]